MKATEKKFEQMEKDRNTEKALRSKLEEEYMQIMQKHEEEVELRLKFEEKLNQMHTEFRKLEIDLERTTLNYKNVR